MSLSLQLSINEKMNAEFSAASSLPMFMQFLSNNFTGFILCSQRLFDISVAPSLRIFLRDFLISSFAISLVSCIIWVKRHLFPYTLTQTENTFPQIHITVEQVIVKVSTQSKHIIISFY